MTLGCLVKAGNKIVLWAANKKPWIGVFVLAGFLSFFLLKVPGSGLAAIGFFQYAWICYKGSFSNGSLRHMCRSLRLGDRADLSPLITLLAATFLIGCGFVVQFE